MTDDELLTLPLDEIAARCPRLSQRQETLARMSDIAHSPAPDELDHERKPWVRALRFGAEHVHPLRETLEAMDALALAVRTVAMARIMVCVTAGLSVRSDPEYAPMIDTSVWRLAGDPVRDGVYWRVLRRRSVTEVDVLFDVEGDRHEVASQVLAAIVAEVDRD